MTHFPVIVLVPNDGRDPVEDADRLLAPYDENGEWFAEGSRWDWWQVGGRWTGSLDGYRPEDDPDNVETCITCGGSGRRSDAERFGEAWMERTNGCNGCEGKGVRVAWPTEWKRHEGDVRLVSTIRTEFLPTAVVTSDGEWHEEARMGWFGMERERKESPGDWRSIVAKLLFKDHADCVAVLVDCHV